MTGKPHNPWSLTNNEMAIAEGIICKSLTWNLNCFPSLPTEAMLYIVATHKSLLYFGLHFLLPSQDTYIITSIFSCINSTSSSQHGPFHQHLCSYKNKANLPSPPSYPSICCPLFFHITVKFLKMLAIVSLYFLTSHLFFNISQSCLWSPHINSCYKHSNLYPSKWK